MDWKIAAFCTDQELDAILDQIGGTPDCVVPLFRHIRQAVIECKMHRQEVINEEMAKEERLTKDIY